MLYLHEIIVSVLENKSTPFLLQQKRGWGLTIIYYERVPIAYSFILSFLFIF